MIGKIKNFVSDVAKEMKKVSWPTKAQIKESTAVVIITSLLFTVIVYLLDWIMAKIVGLIFPI